MRNHFHFPKRLSGTSLHSLSKLYDVPVCFVTPTLIWGTVLLYLRSPKGCCCLISYDLSCNASPNCIITTTNRIFQMTAIKSKERNNMVWYPKLVNMYLKMRICGVPQVCSWFFHMFRSIIEKVSRYIRGEKTCNDTTCSGKLVTTIGA